MKRFQNNHPEDTLGQMASPKSGHHLRMPPESGGIPFNVHFWKVLECHLNQVVFLSISTFGRCICPNVVSRVDLVVKATPREVLLSGVAELLPASVEVRGHARWHLVLISGM